MILKTRQKEQVLPQPVVLISTVGKNGVRNIAPWSNITPILRPLYENAQPFSIMLGDRGMWFTRPGCT